MTPYEPLHCSFCGGLIEEVLFFTIPLPKEPKIILALTCCIACRPEDKKLTTEMRERAVTWMFKRNRT